MDKDDDNRFVEVLSLWLYRKKHPVTALILKKDYLYSLKYINMKIFISLLLAFTLMLFHLFTNNRNTPKISFTAKQNAEAYKKKFAYSCSPDFTLLNFDSADQSIPLLTGWGNYGMPVTHSNDSAYIYFQQGINLYYAFHIIESLASFDKAVSFDKNFAMGYWGKALAYGPNINDFDYHISPDAIASMQKAKELYANNTTLEKALIDAVQYRFSADSTISADELKQEYAWAMKKVYAKYSNNADAAALYADALMVQHPWDLYDKDFNPKPWTPLIVSVLEKIIAKKPNHPGACHYYIHAIEASAHPEKGLDIANRLGAMMPGVSHLVHMPSHIYIRSGDYKKGIDVNVQALNGFYDYLSKFPAVINNAPLYLLHNQHMQATCANMDGQYAAALKTSEETKANIDPSYLDAPGWLGTYIQYVYMTPVFTFIRFGKWDEILNYTMPDDSKVYAGLIGHYARGLAYARRHDITNANKELDMLRVDMNNPQMQEHPEAFNPAIAGANVAEKILQGIIAEENNDLDGAIDILKDAVDREDNMLYGEPKDWPHPAREYLGNTLLRAKYFEEAEKVFRKDLIINPHNGWSLTGLAESLLQQNKNKEAAAAKTEAAKALERSDVKIDSAVF